VGSLKSITFRVVEPMMFRGPSEFTPSIRGPQTVAVSNPVPMPSTVAGALATLVLEALNRPPPMSTEATSFEQLIAILRTAGETLIMRGPYIMSAQGSYVQYREQLVSFKDVREALTKKTDIKKALKILSERVKEGVKEGRGANTVPTLGIKLIDTFTSPSKVAEEGFIYTTKMVDYSRLGKASVAVDVLRGSKSLEETLKTKKLVRLGGEGRITEASASENQPLTEGVRSVADKPSTLWRLYVSTPLILDGKELRGVSAHTTGGVHVYTGFKVREAVAALLKPRLSPEPKKVKVAGQVSVMGGYSLVADRRKPMFPVLMPGSVIEVEGEGLWEPLPFLKIYTEGLGFAAEIGFGTVLPIPICFPT